MLDQCKHASKHGIAAAVMKGRDEMSPDVIEGVYKERVALIAIDEAHILASWGDTFRPTFSRLRELRSHFPTTPFLLLTATYTPKILKHITGKIHLPNMKMLTASPDRPGIYLEYKRGKDIFEELHWLFDEIKQKGIAARKTLLYVRSLGRGGQLYRDILGYLREHAYLNHIKLHHNSHVALYHAGMANKDLDYIHQEISKSGSVIRLIICTIAFGMGINISDIDTVIHWGACDSIMDYWQEVGRAGRDGRSAKALYFLTPGSILQASDDMKELCRSLDKSEVTCFRKSILHHFIGYSSAQSVPVASECQLKCDECGCPRCQCCHICRSCCPCSRT
ncbi:uncharacterized protein LOC125651519 [Ostrea edulis]|uniref:uncharacterized protein LOC125651519 n=1 Tax=Ostrea edulis TaxID=37623 RepID=UPI0024AF4081|nr:uncharacterized protein LOC125651519 [Ostrea edulis]